MRNIGTMFAWRSTLRSGNAPDALSETSGQPPTPSRTVDAMATVEITTESFGPTIDNNDIVIVDFWASWCQPCVRFAPTFEAASQKHADIIFGKVDTEAQQQLAAEASITSIPTLMVFREKVLVFAQPGALNATQLDSVIDAVKALDMKDVHAAVTAKQAEDLAAE